MLRCRVFLTAGALLTLTQIATWAAVPPLVNYQGFLTNPAGDSQVGTFDVTFSIYDEELPSADPSLWSETQSVTTDPEGRFNVLLGTVTPLTEGVFAGPDRWLAIRVSPDLADLTPRTRIATTAYAFRAATIDGASGGTVSGDVAIASGNLEIESSSAAAGIVLKGGAPFIHNFGSDNTFIGINAGNLTMSGVGNTASGVSALQSNTTGGANTASGFGALYSNTSGLFNTAVGELSLARNTNGGLNTASGVYSLYNNTSGNRNTATGHNALYSNTTAGGNTAIGDNALYRNDTGSYNTAGGFEALFNNVAGSDNAAYGHFALKGNISGDFNTAIGSFADVSVDTLSNATAIGAHAIVDASNKIRLGDGNITVLECQVGLTVVSDENQKENLRPVDGDEVLRRLRELRVSSWNLKGQDPVRFRHYGPMAQDFFAAFGNDGVGTVGTPTTINSSDLAGILTIAVQALARRTAENDELKARVEALEKSIAELRSR